MDWDAVDRIFTIAILILGGLGTAFAIGFVYGLNEGVEMEKKRSQAEKK